MSTYPCDDPDVRQTDFPKPVEMVILPRTGDIGGFEVTRALPSRKKRMIGPFIFWDQMGPGEFLEGRGLDVRPHPHIGLSTVSYLFEGTMDHRDSLGTAMTIQPGDVNLMTAGRGIVHSERSGEQARAKRSSLFGIQSWLALPKDREEIAPAFRHTDKTELPKMVGEGLHIRQIMGTGFGMQSPVWQDWETFYADVRMNRDAQLPMPRDVEERGIFVVSGRIEIAGEPYEPGQMISLKPGAVVTVQALENCHLMLLGGAAMDGPRYVWWNFVSHDKDRIAEAAADWQAGEFPRVPGDEEEFIPLPDIRTLHAVKA
jgi:redox-sensitive bicupin YhaK (pirin superfamily)